MRRLILLLVLVAAGCGTSGSVEKQAEEIGSIAAEGALLAHDASEGATTETFTRVHAHELEKRAKKVFRTTRDRRLEAIAASVASELQTLAEDPGEQQIAAILEGSLNDLAKHAEEIRKRAAAS
jgi:hypothetical protein